MNQYAKIREIRRGEQGAVSLVKDKKTGNEYVVKEILINILHQENKDHESQFLKSLCHPNIVDYVDSFEERGNVFIIMSYCAGGDLALLIEKRSKDRGFFEEAQILDWFVQICGAMEFVHSRHILHRHLKPNHIFLTEGNFVKLGDFGIACSLENNLEKANEVVGTPSYMSPEVCENSPYDYKSDVWAMGCILYEMCTLVQAFKASNLLGLVFKIVQVDFDPISNDYSDGLKELINQMLSKEPSKRPTVNKILQSAFINNQIEFFMKSEGSTMGKDVLQQVLTANDMGDSQDQDNSMTSIHCEDELLNDVQILHSNEPDPPDVALLQDEVVQRIQIKIQELEGTPRHHFYVCDRSAFLAQETLEMHEVAVNGYKNLVMILPTNTPPELTLFVSHRWVSSTHPDQDVRRPECNNRKLRGLKFLLGLKEFTHIRYIWMDYLCIPQKNPTQQQLAIDSLPYYARNCGHFVTLFGNDHPCSLMDEYMRRGWCMLEMFASFSSPDARMWRFNFDELCNDTEMLTYIPQNALADFIANPLTGNFTGNTEKEISRITPMLTRLCDLVELTQNDKKIQNRAKAIRNYMEKHPMTENSSTFANTKSSCCVVM